MTMHRISLLGLAALALVFVGCNAEPTLPAENADAGLVYRGATGDVATPEFAPREGEPLNYGGAGSVMRAGEPVQVPWNDEKLKVPTPPMPGETPQPEMKKPTEEGKQDKEDEKQSKAPQPMTAKPTPPKTEEKKEEKKPAEKKTEDKQSALLPLSGELLAMAPAGEQKKS